MNKKYFVRLHGFRVGLTSSTIAGGKFPFRDDVGNWEVVEMYISGKGKLRYLNGDFLQPPQTDPMFRRWRIDNAIVKGWLINSMDSSCIFKFIRFPIPKMVWDAIATTYFDGNDTSQLCDLWRRVTHLKQSDHIQSDVLQIQPFPIVDQAFVHVCKEAFHQAVMTTSCSDDSPVAVLASKSNKYGSHPPTHSGSISLRGSKSGSTSKSRVPPNHDGTKCSYCGNAKHTRENCFKLHRYPDWWHEL
ncbi:uncharacterized protein [Aristolochia californica]|uniref:uncharacterized protein n=1 Tax=Aristolochia californica TaxID=171875 RepID=UPI0035D65674